jgi:hypothetical protein
MLLAGAENIREVALAEASNEQCARLDCGW